MVEYGFRSVDHLERIKMKAAPSALIGPTRMMVTEAMRLVRMGRIDSEERQSVVVKDPQTGQQYSIRDVSVAIVEGRVISTGSSELGLFVNPARFDEEGRVVESMSGVLAPRDPESVTVESIFRLRGIYPQAMREVAEALKRAVVVDIPEDDLLF